jgi:hypothetical protein
MMGHSSTSVAPGHLTGFATPPAEAWVTILERSSGNQARTAVLVNPVGGAADMTTTFTTTRTAGVTKSLESDPAPIPIKVDAVTLAATPTAALGAILGPLINNSVVGPVVLFGAIFFGIFVILPVYAFVQTVYGAIAGVFGLPPTLPLPGTVGALAAANATPALELMSDSPLSDSVPVTIPSVEQADATPATETGKADVPQSVTSTDAATETEPDRLTEPATGNDEMSVGTQTSTGDVTENAAADEASTDPAAANAPGPSANDSASDTAKPAARTRTSRLGDHGSLGLGKLRDLLRPGNEGRPTTRTAASADEKASAGSSSATSSSSTKSSSPGDDSRGGNPSGGDADDS